jgi:ubiquinone/menaquinone biosynthesis C-methylase UbiE
LYTGGWHEIILPSLRDGVGTILPTWFRRITRREYVASQYETVDAARQYKRAYAGQCLEGRLRRERAGRILDLLADSSGGRLLDGGSGPGVLAHSLLQSPRHNFDITVLDQSPAMIQQCVDNAPGAERLHAYVGDLESLPFADGSFDVTVATGALEYTNARTAISELSRVTRSDGIVIISMLNPLSPYQLTQWLLFWPVLRVLGVIEKAFGLRPGRRHGAPKSGIRAIRRSALLEIMREAELIGAEVVYLAPTMLVPPLDRLPGVARRADQVMPALAALHLTPWLATAYLVKARRR